VQLPAP